AHEHRQRASSVAPPAPQPPPPATIARPSPPAHGPAPASGELPRPNGSVLTHPGSPGRARHPTSGPRSPPASRGTILIQALQGPSGATEGSPADGWDTEPASTNNDPDPCH